jgi:hypothetical protein
MCIWMTGHPAGPAALRRDNQTCGIIGGHE